jgi:hypothetical protein
MWDHPLRKRGYIGIREKRREHQTKHYSKNE